MTDKRKPSDGPYKQVFYQNNRLKPYTDTKMGLDDYLQTDVWLKLRNERLKMDFYRCAHCGSAINPQVHHLRYPEVWGEEDVESDLITLCAPHHAEVHKQDIINKEEIK